MNNKNGNIVYEKSFSFAIRIINLYKYLCNEKKEYILSKQVLRSGTSIGANISESLRAQSKKDFIAKMHIAFKEAGETEYWLQLLVATQYVKQEFGQSLLTDLDEIIKILSSIIKTAKQNS